MKTGIERIAEERKRQIEKEGWSSTHDDGHVSGDLAAAGRSYALYAYWQLNPYTGWTKDGIEEIIAENEWPWSEEWWKPSEDPVRNLEKAGALIAAEIDRIQRIKSGESEPQPPFCVGCGYKLHCIGDSQKSDYCPDSNFQKWLLSGKGRKLV